ncbi:MAG: hypothetical protein JF609_01655 [Verrucomicrobia bacterium]|nr:hypothetical protein [Verrucomicrobiota bacterium]
MNPRVVLFASLIEFASVFEVRGTVFVPAKKGVTNNWEIFQTRVLADVPAVATNNVDAGLSKFGGLQARRVSASGYFYRTNLAGRWWLVDPEGCLYVQRGVSDVAISHGANSQRVLREKFGSESNWAAGATTLLRSQGFTGLGAWSDVDHLRQVQQPLVYTRILNLMGGYGQQRGGTYQQSGHLGYPNDCIFVFDPGFEEYCDNQARQLAAFKNDPWLLGYFSDNELPLRRGVLKNFLSLPKSDPGHQAAAKWWQTRRGANAAEITEQDEKDFLAVVVDRYFRIVSTAIKKYDPNHLFLGSRFNGRVLDQPEVFRAAGPYLDVVSANYYWAWTPSKEKLAMWERESGRPVMITEWYAKAEDSGMGNMGGAGWIVKTQRDRGAFYQNFTLGLLECKSCVGWDWFKYADNDPTNIKADPSNRDANKGLVNIKYEPYQPLLEAMKPLNERTYSLIDYFDRVAVKLSDKQGAHL